eukprot:TRINITY_DN19128_c0_g1_i1.p1 TRINITY_DN19128_c0_g1~~TRINITY_DN19128_c0_g1_i1.p1  ORF type:complete len:577 (+),score=58.21 TRINITY_DN19128_c0_g1_i1:26-1756(+)
MDSLQQYMANRRSPCSREWLERDQCEEKRKVNGPKVLGGKLPWQAQITSDLPPMFVEEDTPARGLPSVQIDAPSDQGSNPAKPSPRPQLSLLRAKLAKPASTAPPTTELSPEQENLLREARQYVNSRPVSHAKEGPVVAAKTASVTQQLQRRREQQERQLEEAMAALSVAKGPTAQSGPAKVDRQPPKQPAEPTPKGKFCGSCGHGIGDKGRFCMNCGQPVSSVQQEEKFEAQEATQHPKPDGGQAVRGDAGRVEQGDVQQVAGGRSGNGKAKPKAKAKILSVPEEQLPTPKEHANDGKVVEEDVSQRIPDTQEIPEGAPGAEDDEGVEGERVPCPVCGRGFFPASLPRHEQICRKVTAKSRQRGAFDTHAQRVAGTEIQQYTSASSAKDSKLSLGAVEKMSKWKIQHLQFQQAMQANRAITKGEAPPPPIEAPDDRVECPTCGRKFAALTAERHIPKCTGSGAGILKRGAGRGAGGNSGAAGPPANPKPLALTAPPPKGVQRSTRYAGDVDPALAGTSRAPPSATRTAPRPAEGLAGRLGAVAAPPRPAVAGDGLGELIGWAATGTQRGKPKGRV